MGQAIPAAKVALRVLLVEDDAIDAKLVTLFSESFERYCANITHVRDIKSALNAIDNASFDMCLLDYWLGGHNSLKFLYDLELRDMRIPTVILSNITLNQVDSLRLTAGGASFLAKGSCSAKALESALEDAFAASYVPDVERSSGAFNANRKPSGPVYVD